MKIKEGFYLKNIHGQCTVCSKNTVNAPLGSIVLTETSEFLWNCISEKEMTKEQMLNALLERFDISTVLALSNIDVFVKILRENDIID